MKKIKKIDNFFNNYLDNITKSLLEVNKTNLNKAADEILKTIKRKGTIFVCGNGGSAAISNHYICDFLKYLRQKTSLKPKIISLSNNIETLTAISNDLDYRYVFSYQAESLCEKNDLILIISSSGNSKNILEILKFSKKNKIKTIGFSGFSGGKLRKACDISVHVNVKNYGIAEDSHHILMHIILQYIIEFVNQ
tara:strand:+ start:1203 stop:1784 length:582 start_codon:yes stop_codon:yes gene_type:complete